MVKRTLHFSTPAYLSTKLDQLIVELKEPVKSQVSVPIEDIGVVVLEHQQITLTTALLERLAERKVAVVSCDAKFMPSGLFLPFEGHSEQTERMKHQLLSSIPLKKQLWQQTIKAKIANQAAVLDEIGHPTGYLLNLRDKVKSGDPQNLEGQAAAYYWKMLFGDSFVRGRFTQTPNAQLNYGYAILRSVVARALVASGLFPSVGIHHKSKYNAFCLADDIMEPYRPYVDKLILDHSLHDDGAQEGLTKEDRTTLLKLIQMDVTIEDKQRPLFHAVSSTTASLTQCFSGESRKIKYPTL
jgi:CRISPR-associated protein Cas1